MAGLFLFLFVLALITCIVWGIIDGYEDGTFIFILSIIVGLFIIAIPISRLETKSAVIECIALQEALDYNRSQPSEMASIERHPLMEHLIVANRHISNWKTKGDKWYQNKWYYHPSTQNIEFIH